MYGKGLVFSVPFGIPAYAGKTVGDGRVTVEGGGKDGKKGGRAIRATAFIECRNASITQPLRLTVPRKVSPKTREPAVTPSRNHFWLC